MASATVNQQMVRKEDELMKQIRETHKPDGKEFDLQPLLDVAGDAIRRAKAWLTGKDNKIPTVGLRYQPDDLLFSNIKIVSCEFSCNCSGVLDIIKLLKLLESYSWEAKAAIILAAFASNLGLYCVVAQLYDESHPFAKPLALLQLPPNILKQSSLKPKFKELLHISEVVLGLIKDTVMAKIQFQSVYNENHSVKAASLIAESIVACASEMWNTVAKGMDYEPTESVAKKLSGLANRIKKMRSDLEEDIQKWKKNDKTALNKSFEDFKKRIEGTFENIIDFLLVLFPSKDNQLVLYDCSAKTEGEEQLSNIKRVKHVILYISKIEYLSEDEYFDLRDKYKKKSTDQYEIVWVPIVDESTSWNAEMKEKFEKIRDSMPWLSIIDPSKLNKAFIKYVKKVWKFQEVSRLVVLDPKGKVKKSGDVALFWIWEKSAFKFESDSWEEEDEVIWKLTTIQLLQDTMGSKVDDWVRQDKYIFLFGGEDIDWIKRFIAAVQAVVKATKIDCVMLSVGKSAMKWGRHQEVEGNIPLEVNRFIEKKHMSAFWATLRGLWLTKMETGKSIVEETVMKDIVTFLGFDEAGEGWAAVCRGSRGTMAKLQGAPIIQMLETYADKTKKAQKVVDLVDYLVQKIRKIIPKESDHNCYILTLPATKGTTLLRAECIYCHKPMQASITYRCCSEE